MESKFRLGGSGYTIFTFNGSTLAYCQTIQDTSPQPVAQAVAVQSITDKVPIEIVTARAVGPGTLRCTLMETWDLNAWQLLPGFGSARTLLDVFEEQVRQDEIKCMRIIRRPNGGPRAKVYHNCKITDIDDSEQVNISTMVMPKGFTIMYTHATWTDQSRGLSVPGFNTGGQIPGVPSSTGG